MIVMSSGVSLPNQSFRFSNGDVADIQQIKTFNTGSRTPSSRWCRFNNNQNQQQSTTINTITLRGLPMFRKKCKSGDICFSMPLAVCFCIVAQDCLLRGWGVACNDWNQDIDSLEWNHYGNTTSNTSLRHFTSLHALVDLVRFETIPPVHTTTHSLNAFCPFKRLHPKSL